MNTGLVGFVVLPVIGLTAPPFPAPGHDALAATLDPGTTGRGVAGATLMVGAFELVRAWRNRTVEQHPSAPIGTDPEPI